MLHPIPETSVGFIVVETKRDSLDTVVIAVLDVVVIKVVVVVVVLVEVVDVEVVVIVVEGLGDVLVVKSIRVGLVVGFGEILGVVIIDEPS